MNRDVFEADFVKRIYISEISIASDGSFELYYLTDGMFTDYVIIVGGDFESGFYYANLAG